MVRDEEFDRRMEIYLQQQRQKVRVHLWVTVIVVAICAVLLFWVDPINQMQAFDTCSKQFSDQYCREALK
jgi:DNA-binding transcriptional regulator of glucitol operon